MALCCPGEPLSHFSSEFQKSTSTCCSSSSSSSSFSSSSSSSTFYSRGRDSINHSVIWSVHRSVGWSILFYFFGVVWPVSDFNLHHCPCPPRMVDFVLYTALFFFSFCLLLFFSSSSSSFFFIFFSFSILLLLFLLLLPSPSTSFMQWPRRGQRPMIAHRRDLTLLSFVLLPPPPSG